MNKNIFSVNRNRMSVESNPVVASVATIKKNKNFGEMITKVIGQAKHYLNQSEALLINPSTELQRDYTSAAIRVEGMDKFDADFISADVLIISDCGEVDIRKIKAKVLFLHNIERLYVSDCRTNNIAGVALGTVGFGNLRVFEIAVMQSMVMLMVEEILSAEACYFASSIVQLNESAVDVQKMRLWGHHLRNNRGKELKYSIKDAQQHEEIAMVDVDKLSSDIESLLGPEAFFDTTEKKEIGFTEDQIGIVAAFGMARTLVDFFYGGPEKMVTSAMATGAVVGALCDTLPGKEDIKEENQCVHILSTIENVNIQDNEVAVAPVDTDANADTVQSAPVPGTGSKATKVSGDKK